MMQYYFRCCKWYTKQLNHSSPDKIQGEAQSQWGLWGGKKKKEKDLLYSSVRFERVPLGQVTSWDVSLIFDIFRSTFFTSGGVRIGSFPEVNIVFFLVEVESPPLLVMAATRDRRLSEQWFKKNSSETVWRNTGDQTVRRQTGPSQPAFRHFQSASLKYRWFVYAGTLQII